MIARFHDKLGILELLLSVLAMYLVQRLRTVTVSIDYMMMDYSLVRPRNSGVAQFKVRPNTWTMLLRSITSVYVNMKHDSAPPQNCSTSAYLYLQLDGLSGYIVQKRWVQATTATVDWSRLCIYCSLRLESMRLYRCNLSRAHFCSPLLHNIASWIEMGIINQLLVLSWQ